MRVFRFFLTLTAALALVGSLGPAAAHTHAADVLYVGDDGDDTVKCFDAGSGVLHWVSDGPDMSNLAGPRGIVVDGSELLVANQNVDIDLSGEVLRYNGLTGEFLGKAISSANPNAPFAPDGIVLTGEDLLVASVIRKQNTGPAGRVNQYAYSGTLLREMKMKNNEHHPRGTVFGPDGQLYVSARDLKDGQGGTVLRFNAEGKASVFIDDKGGFGRLNRPDGLVFGPDGCLYVTSFRSAPGDTDSIRIYSPAGDFIDKIDLHNGTTDVRVYAQSCLFGPEGKLFVPMNNTGEVRRYHSPTTGDYNVLVPAGGPLLAPFYLTFGKTNPSTLNYEASVQ